jgi:uncharacterized protein YecT (DUF1311 family)
MMSGRSGRVIATGLVFVIFGFLAAGSSSDKNSGKTGSEAVAGSSGGSGSSGKPSKSECDMKLPTSVWYAAFDKGKFSPAELIIGTTIAAYAINGFELDEKELRNQSNSLLEVGWGKFKDKSIPACLEKVDLRFTNRTLGERKTECFAAAYTSDKEFGMFRDIKMMKCDEIEAEMPKWAEVKGVTGMKYSAAPAAKVDSTPAAASTPAPAPEAKTPTASAAPSDEGGFSPSFDCSKASNSQEKMVCSDRELSRLDVEMSQAYARARQLSADKDALRNEQLTWLKGSFRECPDKSCLADAYKKRIALLQ